MLVHVSPKEEDLCETICTLNFAARVRSVRLGNEDPIVSICSLAFFKIFSFLMVISHNVRIRMKFIVKIESFPFQEPVEYFTQSLLEEKKCHSPLSL